MLAGALLVWFNARPKQTFLMTLTLLQLAFMTLLTPDFIANSRVPDTLWHGGLSLHASVATSQGYWYTEYPQAYPLTYFLHPIMLILTGMPPETYVRSFPVISVVAFFFVWYSISRVFSKDSRTIALSTALGILGSYALSLHVSPYAISQIFVLAYLFLLFRKNLGRASFLMKIFLLVVIVLSHPFAPIIVFAFLLGTILSTVKRSGEFSSREALSALLLVVLTGGYDLFFHTSALTKTTLLPPLIRLLLWPPDFSGVSPIPSAYPWLSILRTTVPVSFAASAILCVLWLMKNHRLTQLPRTHLSLVIIGILGFFVGLFGGFATGYRDRGIVVSIYSIALLAPNVTPRRAASVLLIWTLALGFLHPTVIYTTEAAFTYPNSEVKAMSFLSTALLSRTFFMWRPEQLAWFTTTDLRFVDAFEDANLALFRQSAMIELASRKEAGPYHSLINLAISDGHWARVYSNLSSTIYIRL